MYPAPMMTAVAGRRVLIDSAKARLSPIECSRCTPSPGPNAAGPVSPGIGGRADTAPVPKTSTS